MPFGAYYIRGKQCQIYTHVQKGYREDSSVIKGKDFKRQHCPKKMGDVQEIKCRPCKYEQCQGETTGIKFTIFYTVTKA